MSKTHVIDGVTYVEVDRRAKVGDKVVIINAIAANGMYKNSDILLAEEINDSGIFNEKVSSATNRCYNPNGYISDLEYHVLEPAESEESEPDIHDLLANLANRVHSLEQQLRDTQGNVEKLAEELENANHRIRKHATMFGMLTDDIITLDERSQVLNAINKYYEEGCR
jgi:DNA repair ATPase RecN